MEISLCHVVKQMVRHEICGGRKNEIKVSLLKYLNICDLRLHLVYDWRFFVGCERYIQFSISMSSFWVYLKGGKYLNQSNNVSQKILNKLDGTHWSRVSAFACRSRGPWFESCVNWYPERAVCVQVICTQNWEWNSFPKETRTLVS